MSVSLLSFFRAENHQTQSDFENALILKLFAFQFVNNYSILFYLAVLRPEDLVSVDAMLMSHVFAHVYCKVPSNPGRCDHSGFIHEGL